MPDLYTGKIRATIMDGDYNVIEQRLIDLATRESRFQVREMANRCYSKGYKFLTERWEEEDA